MLAGSKIGVWTGPDDMRDCTTTGFAEDAVIQDAEGGVRLVPLSMTRKQYGDSSGGSSVCARARGAAGGNNISDGGNLRGWGYRVGKLWGWVRGGGVGREEGEE